MVAVGSTVGPYEVVGLLRSGGMADLYLGSRTGPGGFHRRVVIKAIKGHLSTHDDFVKMFLDEGRIAARIQHPNVVRIEELGEADGTYYLVMEFVHGVALSELLSELAQRGRRLSPAATVAIGVAAATGLAAAHETRGDDGRLLHVVHRDVSPQNILIGMMGQVKVIDFGIAKARDRLHVTDHASGGLKGKLRYMAPEQLLSDEVDGRSDVYSLGVVLWEMLTMRRLFQGRSDAEVIRLIQKGQFPPPSAFASIPPAVDRVILKALARDPSLRHANATELARELRAAVPEGQVIDPNSISAMSAAVCSEVLAQRAELAGRAQGSFAPETISEAYGRLTRPVGQDFDDSSTTEIMKQSSVPEYVVPSAGGQPVATLLSVPEPGGVSTMAMGEVRGPLDSSRPGAPARAIQTPPISTPSAPAWSSPAWAKPEAAILAQPSPPQPSASPPKMAAQPMAAQPTGLAHSGPSPAVGANAGMNTAGDLAAPPPASGQAPQEEVSTATLVIVAVLGLLVGAVIVLGLLLLFG